MADSNNTACFDWRSLVVHWTPLRNASLRPAHPFGGFTSLIKIVVYDTKLSSCFVTSHCVLHMAVLCRRPIPPYSILVIIFIVRFSNSETARAIGMPLHRASVYLFQLYTCVCAHARQRVEKRGGGEKTERSKFFFIIVRAAKIRVEYATIILLYSRMINSRRWCCCRYCCPPYAYNKYIYIRIDSITITTTNRGATH